MPAATGGGLAMRAGITLEALARDHQIDLLVIPVVGLAGSPAWARQFCTRVQVLPLETVDGLWSLIERVIDPAEQFAAWRSYPKPALCRFATKHAVDAAARMIGGRRFDELLVFRLYLAPFAAPFLERCARRRLDLDEDEAHTLRSIATLERGRAAAARLVEAERYVALARDQFANFERLFVASPTERGRMLRRWKTAPIVVVPNAVRPPRNNSTAPRGGPLLFVGNLGYAPNVDAVQFLCDEIMPRLRAKVRIVGPHAPASLSRLANPRVTFCGYQRSLTRAYHEARAVVVPLRGGGGTRVKILEAFSRARPVVSTRIGAEGIAATHGEELLVADGAAAIATACQRLLEDHALARELARAAKMFVTVHHSVDRVHESLRSDRV